MKQIFIIGTDTEIGKTYCTQLILRALHQEHKTVIGVKPIASGATWQNGQLQNEDALKLITASSMQFPYALHNPFVFADAIAPHIAAQQNNTSLSVDNVIQQLKPILMNAVDLILLEGAGGLFTPLNDTQLFSDLIYAMNLPIILIVNLKLGCINHALLTINAMTNRNLNCIGWIANNCQQETDYTYMMLEDLKKRLSIPHLITIGHHQSVLTPAQIHHILHFFF